MPLESLPQDYPRFIQGLKERIRLARLKAALSINRELIALYWDLGRQIVEKQKRERWGTSVLKKVSLDLRSAFPEAKGFSRQNLQLMRAFYRAWVDDRSICQRRVGKLTILQRTVGESPILQQTAAELATPPAPLADLPWRHNIALIEKLSSRQERLWYAHEALRNGWTRDVLVRHIENGLHQHKGKAQTNFALTLPAPQAKLAQEALKDEYTLDFLRPGITQEKDIEQGIIQNAQRFLMELGKGFAFIGRQHRVEAGGKEHVFDLLLYNTFLHCYVVVELKNVPFQPEHVSQLSAYLSAADERLRRDGDQASIGVILCRSKNRIVVEYALRDQKRPIGVACYRLTRELPGPLKKILPTARQLEHGLGETS
ncbi:MAG: DUF1016 domain-containing protein [Elusimicrobia bacterium]|nr:DUF1016 domain-containing protein [Elusimicrobiota bacterium]